MNDKVKNEKIALMCREILDGEQPFYWGKSYNLSDREKDYTIDFLLRAVLGYAEIDTERLQVGGMDYVEEKFYSAYDKITKNKILP